MSLAAAPLRVAIATALLAAAGCGGLPLEATMSSHARARKAVDAWAARHRTGWTVALQTGAALPRPAWAPPCSASPASGFVLVRFESRDAEVDLAFRCPMGAGEGSAALRERFAFAVLGRLPHGIAVPGWTFVVRTPTSSIEQGVTFTDVGAGRVRVDIDTPLFAVYGQDTRPACRPPADAAMPEGCYVHREHRVPLRLTLVAPIAMATLR